MRESIRKKKLEDEKDKYTDQLVSPQGGGGGEVLRGKVSTFEDGQARHEKISANEPATTSGKCRGAGRGTQESLERVPVKKDDNSSKRNPQRKGEARARYFSPNREQKSQVWGKTGVVTKKM